MSEDYADSDEQALMHAVRRGTKKLLLNKCRTRTGVRMTEAQIRKFISDAMGGEEEPGALLGIY